MPILQKVWSILVDLLETLVIAGAIFVVIYAFLFRPYQVNGQSMYPNYHDGEYILTNLIVKRFGELNRGDVIVFHSPVSEDKDFIKRIIGVPGDTVSVRDGNVIVNGEVLDESEYLSSDVRTGGGAYLNESPQIVTEGTYIVMGDNRNFSSDSREWGPVTKDKVIGKSMIVYWPPQDFRFVKHAGYEDN